MSDDTYIMISGIKRSGSTWQANAVRLLYEYHDCEVWMGEEYNGESQAKVTINKVHPFSVQLADRADFVLTSYRDLDEVRKSWHRFRDEFPPKEKFKNWIDWLIKWNLYANHMTQFEMILEEDKEQLELQWICKALGLVPGPSMIDEVQEQLHEIEPPDDEYYDEETLLFHNHRTKH